MSGKNIMIVGVGGQGTLLTSRLLGTALLNEGYDVKVSEVHGMSQRGGSVVTYVKYGEKVFSPVIEKGEADMMISFEALESARWLPYLKKDGVVISNTAQIDPMPVIMGNAVYPDGVLKLIEDQGVKVISADALTLAEQAGSAKAVNIVLMGRLAKYLDISTERWIEEIEKAVKPKFVDINKKAFMLGYNYSC